ncbi:MAG TPA: HAD family hydrolase [Kiritimatiellae bacterium]|nr:HAD family hydrolase [Kiritimatiellia bacterium]
MTHQPTRNRELVDLARRLLRPLDPLPAGVRARYGKLEGVRCILFDIYGTLLVSAAGDVGTAMGSFREDAAAEALFAAGLEIRDGQAASQVVARLPEMIRRSHAASRQDFPEVDIRRIWAELLRDLLDRRLVSGTVDMHAVQRAAVVFECLTNPVWPMPGAAGILQRLRDRGFLLGLVSNAQFYTPLVMEAAFGSDLAGLGLRLDLCAFSYACGVAKPSLRIFDPVLRALQDFYRLSPGHCACVGNDMLNDMQPASRLGMRTVLFAGDGRSLRLREHDPRCRGLRTDAVITSLEQPHSDVLT